MNDGQIKLLEEILRVYFYATRLDEEPFKDEAQRFEDMKKALSTAIGRELK